MSNDYRAYVECDYNSIYHHGVKGMKWGVRRYQNEDGTLKEKGKKRTSQKSLFVAPEGQKKNRSSMVLNALGFDDNKKRHAAQDAMLALTHPVMYRIKKGLQLTQKMKTKKKSNSASGSYEYELKSRYDKVKKENPKWLKDNFGNDSFKDIINNDPDLLYLALDEYDLEKKSKRRSK